LGPSIPKSPSKPGTWKSSRAAVGAATEDLGERVRILHALQPPSDGGIPNSMPS
jgi:hypothetical protein